MKQKELIRLAENQLRQQLIGGLMLLVAGLMITNTFVGLPGFVKAGTANDTNLTFTITSGTFSLANVISDIAFAEQTYGNSGNLLGNNTIDTLDITDYRGTSTAWSVVVNANALSDGTNTISVANLKVWPGNGQVTNVENSDNTEVGFGTNNVTLDGAGANLINGSTSAAGVFQYNNGVLRLTLSGTENAGTYGATATFTLS